MNRHSKPKVIFSRRIKKFGSTDDSKEAIITRKKGFQKRFGEICAIDTHVVNKLINSSKSFLGKRKRGFPSGVGNVKDKKLNQFYFNHSLSNSQKNKKVKMDTVLEDSSHERSNLTVENNDHLVINVNPRCQSLGMFLCRYQGCQNYQKILPVEVLAHGSYGTIYGATLNGTSNKKFVLKHFDIREKSIWFLRQVLNEILINKFLKKCGLKWNLYVGTIIPRNNYDFNDIFLVFKRKRMTLRRFLNDRTKKQKVELKSVYNYYKNKNYIIKKICFTLLKQILTLHQIGILHLDIKSTNILLHKNSKKKIEVYLIDFSLSCQKQHKTTHDSRYVEIISLWYRPIEMIVESLKGVATSASDVWSMGVLLLEMFTGKVVFRGKDVQGMKEIMIDFKKNDVLYELEKGYKIPSNAVDLIERMMCYDWKKRISVLDAIKHEYFKELYNEKEKKEVKRILQLKKLDLEYGTFENAESVEVHLKNRLFREVCN